MVQGLFHSLRDRLLILVLLTVLPAYGLIVYNAVTERQSAIAEAENDSRRVASLIIGQQELAFQQIRSLLTSLSRNQVLAPGGEWTKCSALLGEIKALSPYYANLAVIQPDGSVSCSALTWEAEVNLADREYFRRAVESKEFAVGNYQIGRITNIATVNLAYPVLDPRGSLTGVVFLALDLRWFNQTLANAKQLESSTILVFDRQGTILAVYPERPELIGTTASPQVVSLIGTSSESSRAAILDSESGALAFSLFPLLESESSSAYIGVSVSRDAIYVEANRQFLVNLLFMGLVTLVMLGVAHAGSRIFVLRQVDALTDAARRLSDGDLGARSGLTSETSELGQLSSTFDTMAENLQTRSRDLARVTRALRALSAGNRALVRAAEESELARNNCRILVATGGYIAAVIAYTTRIPVEGETAVVFAVREGGDRPDLGDLWRESNEARDRCAKVMANSIPMVLHDLGRHTTGDALMHAAVDLGAAACMILPIHAGADGAIGCVFIFSSDRNAFEGEELSLLEEMTSDLGFGIATIRTRAGHQLAEEKVHRLAHFDVLTGAPNQTLLLERMAGDIDAAAESDASAALLAVSITRLWEINSAFGRQHGDYILMETKARLEKVCGSSSLVARIGDQSFAIWMPGGNTAAALEAGSRVLRALDAPYECDGLILNVPASAGVAVYPEHGQTAEILLQRAVSSRGRSREHGTALTVFSEKQEEESARRLGMITKMRRAIDGERLVLFCQPKVEIRSRRVCGIEILLRWRESPDEWMSPAEFIPVAEKTGLIRPLTYWVIDRATKYYSGSIERKRRLPIAINLSARNIEDPEIVACLDRSCTEHGIEPGEIELEITEGGLLEDTELCVEVLGRLRHAGFEIHIDDFGTGYSGLGYLKRLPVSTIKIDKSFVGDMLTNRNSETIVRSTIELAHSLGMKVIAEGVEDESTFGRLAEWGCDAAKGFLIARPMPVTELSRWIESGHWSGNPRR